MSEVKRLEVEIEGETYEIYVESKDNLTMPAVSSHIDSDEEEISMGVAPEDIAVKMQEARRMIRGYALYTISAFKNFGLANVEEVKLKFGIKIAAQTGLPFIAQGSSDCNAEIEVKFTFPDEVKDIKP